MSDANMMMSPGMASDNLTPATDAANAAPKTESTASTTTSNNGSTNANAQTSANASTDAMSSHGMADMDMAGIVSQCADAPTSHISDLTPGAMTTQK